MRVRRGARLRRADLRSGVNGGFSIARFPAHLRSAEGALVEITGAAVEDCRAATAAAYMPRPEPDDDTDWQSRSVLLEILAPIVHLTSPRVVVEVGVERGYSSSVILAGLSANGVGELFSIDLPRFAEDDHQFVGRVIPAELRDRWHLTLGPSRQRLPDVLREAGAVDLFLHDGDHSYESQLEDLRRVWPRLRPGAIVVVDDVWTPALLDFGHEVGEHPLLIERWDVHDAIGLMRKSSRVADRSFDPLPVGD